MDLQNQVAKRLFEHIDAGTTDRAADTVELGESDYADPEIARLERERVFATHPLVAAASGDLAEPGCFVTTRILGENVLVARQEDGSLKAFRNVCRHRCATVVTDERGQKRSFSCTYHGWTYALDGSLRVVPDGDGSFPFLDRGAYGLVELPVAERHGLVWVRTTPGPRLDLEAYLGPDIDRELQDFGLADYVCLRCQTFEQPSNWKLIMDGFLEVYHVRYLHARTLGKIAFSNIFIVDELHDHLRMASARKDIENLRPTDAGQPEILPGIILTYALMPNTFLVYVRDHIQCFTVTPHETDPTRCRVTLRFLVPELPTTDKARDYWQRNWDNTVGAVDGEDWEMARQVQSNVTIDSDKRMVLGRNELALHHFHGWLAAQAGRAGSATHGVGQDFGDDEVAAVTRTPVGR